MATISLVLTSGTSLQILHFLGLFPSLDDIDVNWYLNKKLDSTTNHNPELPAQFPMRSLKGELKIAHYTVDTISRDMITPFGELRFQIMDLLNLAESQLLLEACRDTLQSVRVYPTSTKPHPGLFQMHVLMRFTGLEQEALQVYDLSRLHSLRSLEVHACSFTGTRFEQALYDIFSTINSPVFSEVRLVFQRHDLDYSSRIPFYTFRKMHSKMEFRMVCCLEVSKGYRDMGMQVLRKRMESEIEERKWSFLKLPLRLQISERGPWLS